MAFFDRLIKRLLNKSDYAEIDSNEKMMELADNGVLQPLYLMPLRFNGKESVRNRLFVPPDVAALKERYDDMVELLLQQDKVSSYSCIPKYRGKSSIPSKLTIIAGKDGMAVFTETINIW